MFYNDVSRVKVWPALIGFYHDRRRVYHSASYIDALVRTILALPEAVRDTHGCSLLHLALGSKLFCDPLNPEHAACMSGAMLEQQLLTTSPSLSVRYVENMRKIVEGQVYDKEAQIAWVSEMPKVYRDLALLFYDILTYEYYAYDPEFVAKTNSYDNEQLLVREFVAYFDNYRTRDARSVSEQIVCMNTKRLFDAHRCAASEGGLYHNQGIPMFDDTAARCVASRWDKSFSGNGVYSRIDYAQTTVTASYKDGNTVVTLTGKPIMQQPQHIQ